MYLTIRSCWGERMKIEEAINRFNSARHELLRGTEQEVLSNIRKIELLDVALMSFEEIQKYRAIGTVEECRAAAGKQAARMKDGITECCGYDFGTDQFDTDIRFCPKCGRKLDRSDEE